MVLGSNPSGPTSLYSLRGNELRQHLVDLLEENEIPHHKVGSHRRVTFKELLAFEKKRDRTRREALDKLASEVDSAGLHDSSYTGEK